MFETSGHCPNLGGEYLVRLLLMIIMYLELQSRRPEFFYPRPHRFIPQCLYDQMCCLLSDLRN